MKRIICMLMIISLITASVPALAVSRGDRMVVANCNSWVSLRSDASTRAKRIRKLSKGTCVNYIDRAENGFYLVLHNGTRGYVHERYLEMPSDAVRVARCREFVSLRKSCDPRAARKCKIPLGGRMIKLSDAANGFSEVYYCGQRGYVLSRYLKPIDKDDGIERQVVNCHSYVSLRSTPSTKAERLAKIPRRAKVSSIASVGNGMEYVYYDGQYGYVLSKYLKNL